MNPDDGMIMLCAKLPDLLHPSQTKGAFPRGVALTVLQRSQG